MLLRNRILEGLFLVLFTLHLNVVLGEIHIYKNTSTTQAIISVFAEQLEELETKHAKIPDGKWIYIAAAEPEIGCNGLTPAAKDLVSEDHEWWVLIKYEMEEDLDCSYQVKAQNAIAAGFHGLILYMNSKDSEKAMVSAEHRKRSEDGPSSDSSLPVLLVRPADGEKIREAYTYDKGYLAVIGEMASQKETQKAPRALMGLTIVVGVFVVLLGLCICGVLARKLLNLNKN